MKNNSDNPQYNSCVSKGICSVNPRTTALQNVLILYLHLFSKYCIKLFEKNELDIQIKDFILNATAIAVANSAFTEYAFMTVIAKLQENMVLVIDKYNEIYNQDDFKGENIFDSDIFKNCKDIIDAIKLGERIFREIITVMPSEIYDLYNIMLIVAKSISINLLELKSFGIEDSEGFETLLNLLDSVRVNCTEKNTIKDIIQEGARCNTDLMIKLYNAREARYGKQGFCEVSYSTTPSKAVLVVGSNIRELENILENLKETDIDIYTHDEMMVAHTYPYFHKYSHLKGQYGYGLENCLLDFSTFPGPIILTKHSLHNIENLYRGRLFTTDLNFYKGVVKIENDNFQPVIEAAELAKGFKNGRVCETINIGYNLDECLNLIDEKLSSGKYKKMVIFGLKDYADNINNYFENLVKRLDKDVLIISFSYNVNQENFLYFNTCFDYYAIVRVSEKLLKYKISMNAFLPKCNRNTVAELLYFNAFDIVNVYLGICEPITINPSLINTLSQEFKINLISTPQKDAESINNL